MSNYAKKILFLVAHQDDEILGCGGTLFKKSEEFTIDILFLSDGSSSRNENEINRDQIARNIHSSLVNPGDIFFLGLPDNKLDSLTLLDIIKHIEQKIGNDLSMKYDEIYTHSSSDLNIDHQVASKISRVLFRPQPNIRTKKLVEFETPSATEWSFNSLFRPNLFIDISNFWDKKRASLEQYRSELREFPHPRSFEAVEALAKYRGCMVGYQFAEAFELIWERG